MERTGHSADIDKWLILAKADGVGPVTFARLLDYFGSIDEILGANTFQLQKVKGIAKVASEKIAASIKINNPIKEIAFADKLGVKIIHSQDSRYPTLLTKSYDPPPVLYVKGNLTMADNLAVAIVGARRCSNYGAEQASRFAHLLSAAGFTIVSGLARGVDSYAHQGAIAATGRTIAVLGNGLANVYPPEHKKLFEQITGCGACISELSLTAQPKAEHFPARNRIIAAMTLATIVVEASLRSGAMITATAAMDNNREVMAVPGKIDSYLSAGPNKLIKQGATLIDSVEDVVEALGHIGRKLKEHAKKATNLAVEKTREVSNTPELKLTEHERNIYKALSNETMFADQIINECNIEPGQVNSCLISMQLKGLVKQLAGGLYELKTKKQLL